MMLRTVYSKLALVLLGLFMVIGGLAIAVTVFSASLYQQEVDQKLNRDLAQHIVGEKTLIRDKLVNHAALEDVFHMMMVINPSIEFYLLDPQGKLLAYSAEPGKVKRQTVDLDPLQRVLAGQERFPILGDDPRDDTRRKVFSVARVLSGTRLEGYLYIILGGENYASVAQKLSGSYIVSASAGVIAAAVSVSLLSGLLLFALVTGKLRRLAYAMRQFKPGELPALTVLRGAGDEIDELTVTFRDMATQINAQLAQVQQADNLRRELVANVSHDLRTPLATLHGYLETLTLKSNSLSPQERDRYLQTAGLQCVRLNKLVTELFELARLDAADRPLNREPFSLAELAQDTLQKFQLKAQEKHIHIGLRVTQSLPFVSGDIALVERVLENLLENALRYTPAGGSVELLLTPTPQAVTVQVQDTGCGIPADALPRVFDRFYQLDKSRNSSPGISGLGLAIAKRILELHGSSIAVQSAVDRGTTFTFELPAHATG